MKRRDYLNPQMRKYYETRVKNAERSLENIKTSTFQSERDLDPVPIRKRKRRDERILAERTAPKLTGKAKDKAWRRYEELKKELRSELMSKNDMHPLKTVDGKVVADMDTARHNAHDLVKRWEQEKQKTKELRDLASILEPDDPDIRNVENLRKQRR